LQKGTTVGKPVIDVTGFFVPRFEIKNPIRIPGRKDVQIFDKVLQR